MIYETWRDHIFGQDIIDKESVERSCYSSAYNFSYDENLDLALLKIFNVTYPEMDFADSDRAKVGPRIA